LNLNYLKTFLLVVEKQSFSAAAKILDLSQPAVTLQMQALEENLGMQLLVRKGKGLALTEAGEIVYEQAAKILSLWEATKLALDKVSLAVSGKLSIGASTIPGGYLLPQLIGAFHELYPNVEASLEVADTEGIIEKTLAGELDLGVIGSFFQHDQLKTYSFAQDELVLIVPANHRWALREEIEAEELKGESFIIRKEGSGTRKVMAKKLKEKGIEIKDLKIAMELGTTEAIINGVGGGWGVSFVSRLAAQKALEFGQVKIVEIRDWQIQRVLYLIFSPWKIKRAVVREFLKFSPCDLREEDLEGGNPGNGRN